MAVLGGEGRLRLKRERPDPLVVLPPPPCDPPNSIQAGVTGLWSGDEVQISSPLGLPLLSPSGVPLAPRGMGIFPETALYRSPAWRGDYGPYDSPLTSGPWERGPELQDAVVYASFDQTGRISFYSTKAGALNGEAFELLELGLVDFGEMTVTSLDGNWLCMASLKSWSLELDAAAAQTTGLGAKFGDSIKTLVTGSGTVDFMVDRLSGEGIGDPTVLMRLLLMLEKGCKADAEFWMIAKRGGSIFEGLLPGDLYYSSAILVVGTGAAANVDGSLMSGSARFVTTGEVRLKEGVGVAEDCAFAYACT